MDAICWMLPQRAQRRQASGVACRMQCAAVNGGGGTKQGGRRSGLHRLQPSCCTPVQDTTAQSPYQLEGGDVLPLALPSEPPSDGGLVTVGGADLDPTTHELDELVCPLGLYNISQSDGSAQLPWLPDAVPDKPPAGEGQAAAGGGWAALRLLIAAAVVAAALVLGALVLGHRRPGLQLLVDGSEELVAVGKAMGSAAALPAAVVHADAGGGQGAAAADGTPGGKSKAKKRKGKSSTHGSGDGGALSKPESQAAAAPSPAPGDGGGASANGLATSAQGPPPAAADGHGSNTSTPVPPSAVASQGSGQLSIEQILSDAGSRHSSESGALPPPPPLSANAKRAIKGEDGAVLIGRLRVGPGILGYGSAGGLGGWGNGLGLVEVEGVCVCGHQQCFLLTCFVGPHDSATLPPLSCNPTTMLQPQARLCMRACWMGGPWRSSACCASFMTWHTKRFRCARREGGACCVWGVNVLGVGCKRAV